MKRLRSPSSAEAAFLGRGGGHLVIDIADLGPGHGPETQTDGLVAHETHLDGGQGHQGAIDLEAQALDAARPGIALRVVEEVLDIDPKWSWRDGHPVQHHRRRGDQAENV